MTGSASSGGEITFLATGPTESDGQKKFYNQLIKAFNNNTNHTVNMRTVGTEQANKRVRSLQAAGKTPHIVSGACRDCFSLGAMELSGLLEQSEIPNKLGSSVTELAELFGQIAKPDAKNPIMSLPVSIEFYQPVFDMDWVEAAGYTESDVNWEAGPLDWINDVEPLFQSMLESPLGQQDGNYPGHLALKAGDCETQQQWIAQFGGSPYGFVTTDLSEEAITRPEAVEAIKTQKRFWDKGYTNPNSIGWGDEEATPQMWANKLGQLNVQDTNDNWASFNSEVPKEMKNGRFTWNPGFKGPNGEPTQLGDLTSMVFMKDAFTNQAQREAAIAFFEMWLEPKWQERMTKMGGLLPANPAATDRPFYTQSELHKRYFSQAVQSTLENVRLVPEEPPIPGAAEAINQEIPRQMWVKILKQDTPVEEAVNWAGKQINSELQN